MQLMAQAMKLKVGSPSRKLVLLKLADHANDNGECWPSYQHIADQTELSRRAVISHIEHLKAQGFLKIQRRQVGPDRHQSNLYKLNLGGEKSALPSEPFAPPSEKSALGGGEKSAPRISHSFESVKEPRGELVQPKGLSGEPPEWWDQKSWDEWIHWRKTEKRCRVTQSAANKQFHQIKKFVEDGYSMAEIVDTAIRNDWRGLYAPNRPRSNFNSANGGLVV